MNQTPYNGSRTCLRIASNGILGMCLLLGLAAYLLLGYAPVPAATPDPIDIDRVRQLAVEGGQPLPVRVNTLLVAEASFPGGLVVAGSGTQSRPLSISTFQIVYPDKTILVDAAYTQEMHEQMFAMFGGGSFSKEAYERLQGALRESSLILLTHEHLDHVGGLASADHLEAMQPKVYLTRAQIDNLGPEMGFPEDVLAGFASLDYEDYAQAAPGVVLIAMPGHSPGSQLIYVRLQSGVEYLLVGDVLWSALSLEKQSGRPWLMNLMLGEERSIIGQQTRALIDLADAIPDLHLVISHDEAQIQQLIRDGVLGSAFE